MMGDRLGQSGCRGDEAKEEGYYMVWRPTLRLAYG